MNDFKINKMKNNNSNCFIFILLNIIEIKICISYLSEGMAIKGLIINF